MELNINFDKKYEHIINLYQPLAAWFEKNQEWMAYFELTKPGCDFFENANVSYDLVVLGRMVDKCLSILELDEIKSDYDKALLASESIGRIYEENESKLSIATRANYKINIIKSNFSSKEEKEELFVEQKNPFNANGPVYAFTNEALNQYMVNYDFEGKTVLVSLGSGDFALNAYLLGAKNVDSFDINQYTYYFYQLKKSLIIKYNYEEFCSLIKNPTTIFIKFDEFKDLLDEESKTFFEKLLKIYGTNYKELINKMYIDKIGEKNEWNESNTFDSLEEFFLISKYKNLYLKNSESYNSLKAKVSNNNDDFYFNDLATFIPEKKYDIIYLSNIGDYFKNEDDFKKVIEIIKENCLNENGIIIITSISNHIYMNSDEAERLQMDWDEMREFNEKYEGIAYLPLSNLGIQNVYTTFPYKKSWIMG